MAGLLAPHPEPDRESAIQKWRDEIDVFWRRWNHQIPPDPVEKLWEGFPAGEERTVEDMKLWARRPDFNPQELREKKDAYEEERRVLEIRGSVLGLAEWEVNSILELAREMPPNNTSQ